MSNFYEVEHVIPVILGVGSIIIKLASLVLRFHTIILKLFSALIIRSVPSTSIIKCISLSCNGRSYPDLLLLIS